MEKEKDFKFVLDKRMGIKLPKLNKDWEEFTHEDQVEIIRTWESERAKIPERIKEIEEEIMEKQDSMFDISFEDYIKLHTDIVDLSSALNDLYIWFRTEGELTHKG